MIGSGMGLVFFKDKAPGTKKDLNDQPFTSLEEPRISNFQKLIVFNWNL